MKAVIYCLVIFLGMTWNVRADKIVVKVVDGERNPIEGASVIIEFVRPQQIASKAHSGKTDDSGFFSASGRILLGLFVEVTKEGYYKGVREKEFGKGDHNITVVMRKIRNPIPLYVRDVKLEFPAYDKWLAYDFEVGDWVAPQGRGKSKDISFRFHREFKGYKFSKKKMEKMKFPDTTEEDLKKFYGNWEAVLAIAFPSKLTGIIEEKDSYLPYSEMKMPHLAPKEGYRGEEIVIEERSVKSDKEKKEEFKRYLKFGKAKPIGYYIRTRVTEVGGKITKAHYLKMPEAFEVGAAGTVSFTYYYNPVVNDRNLEYAGGREQNLAKEQQMWFDP